MNVYRYEENPLLTPADVKPHRFDYEVIGAFNAGVTQFNDEIIMLLRVAERPVSDDPNIIKAPVLNHKTGELKVLSFHREDKTYDFSDPRAIKLAGQDSFVYLTSLSYFRIARSKDGHRFTVDDKPFLFPKTSLETFGIEDPRIARIEDTYYISFSEVSPVGVGTGFASTKDFVHVEHHGMMLAPENKDVVLFPEKINGKYYVLHRPVPKSTGAPEIWIAESDNLRYWGNHRYLMGLRPNHWDNGRLGAGAAPFKTEKGWLELYHAADESHRYCMGAVLLDLEDPSKVLARTNQPILAPEASYEVEGFFGNVVFSCGALVDGDIVKIYYGVADTSMACAELSLHEILASLTYLEN
ncbi:glycoside hydrolase family 130 protein [Alicyclobacillus fastidiosus]|uniref:Glycoside hydrolase family 130 protein n=1 Tax=Alicyclobacillus fastidiosus TaxID=392011 RepID=A0ABY6ZJE3_9BACL|nr:glycoside hydrolase family 130 protein [Alicyclobacillus fastidiosus]WAH43050.1 glycoside hydrolase family 130 protein [Alicyclobacillus fastidiosus]GMA65034.1 glycosidase [Alicyclobacillus fastidiosus]